MKYSHLIPAGLLCLGLFVTISAQEVQPKNSWPAKRAGGFRPANYRVRSDSRGGCTEVLR